MSNLPMAISKLSGMNENIMIPGSPEWLAARKYGIGASETAAVLGLSKYASPLDIYLRKTQDGTPSVDTSATRRGRRLEPIVLDMYEETEGAIDRNLPRIDSQEYPFMFASLDARRKDNGIPVEAKTVGMRMLNVWGEPGTDDVPQEYLIQVMHQMIVVKAKEADLAALKVGEDLHVYHFAYDAELAEMIIEALRLFWQRVENREPPAPSTGDEVERLYRKSIAKGIEANGELAGSFIRLKGVRSQIKPLQRQEIALVDDIKKFMADRDTLLIGGEPAVTWKSAKGSARFDTRRFQSEHPGLYAQYLIESVGSRRFLIKGEDNATS